jgi:thiamine biosynthesis lipoprotein
MLTAAGSVNHCVNGGGDVQCAGSAQPGQPWRIGITNPLRPDEFAGVIAGHHLAVATSGTAERGQHIASPAGLGSMAGLASVTLAGESLSTIDAYATAAYAMGSQARAWIETLPDCYGLIVYADGSQWSSMTFATT